MTALAVLSLIAGDENEDDDRSATTLACRAVEVAEAQGLDCRAVVRDRLPGARAGADPQGVRPEAEEQLGRALGVPEIDSMVLHRAHTLLLLASVRRTTGTFQAPRRWWSGRAC